MPASKFTADRCAIVVETYGYGGSLRTAARRAEIDAGTLSRWLERGRTAPEGSRYRKFYLDCEAALGEASVFALRVVRDSMVDKPDLAWKYLERREEGFAPPRLDRPSEKLQPVVVHLTFHDGDPTPEFGGDTVVEIGEVTKDGQLPDTGTDTATP